MPETTNPVVKLIAAARAQEPSAEEVEAAGGQLFTDIAKSTGFTDYSMHDCYVLARAVLRAARSAAQDAQDG